LSIHLSPHPSDGAFSSSISFSFKCAF
jgi:hypothetical protein